MKLIPISGQKGKKLLEFYSPKAWPSNWGEMPEMMCQLILALEAIEHEPVWVFTSHEELLFTDKDDYKTWKVLVRVIEIEGKQSYKITAAQKEPWHHLTGFADDVDLAVEQIIAGLSVSGTGRERDIFLDSN